MATFIHNKGQKKAVNLDNVDSIRLSDGRNEFVIYFEKIAPHGESSAPIVIETWKFENLEDRDTIYDKIMTSFSYPISKGLF